MKIMLTLWCLMASSTLLASYKFNYQFEESLSEAERAQIIQVADEALAKTVQALHGLQREITMNVKVIDRDLTMVNGVTGRADHRNEIEISISKAYPGGITQAVKDGLAFTVYHELHHTIRGWVIHNNAFRPGIQTAIINEGMADVFAEMMSGQQHNHYVDEPDFEAWLKEILALPLRAPYGDWMFSHPDGRMAVGYRTGTYVIEKVMKQSGKTAIDLTALPVSAIYEMIGINYP